MRTIAVYSNKGGTGKTTSVFNIAGVLAKDYGKKVLCVDCDPQANLTGIFLTNEIMEKGSLNFLNGEVTVEDLFLKPERVNEAIRPVLFSLTSRGTPKKRGIDLIPARPKSMHLKKDLDNITTGLDTGALDRGQLKVALSCIRRTATRRYDYDYCLIDFPPAANVLTKDCLGAADYVLSPATMDRSAKEGIASLFAIIADVKEEGNPNLELLGIVPVTFDKRFAYDTQSLDSLQENEHIINTPIRTSSDVKWASEFGIPLAYNKKTAPVTRDYKELVSVLLEKMGDNE